MYCVMIACTVKIVILPELLPEQRSGAANPPADNTER
jgi:hypothetical protein